MVVSEFPRLGECDFECSKKAAVCKGLIYSLALKKEPVIQTTCSRRLAFPHFPSWYKQAQLSICKSAHFPADADALCYAHSRHWLGGQLPCGAPALIYSCLLNQDWGRNFLLRDLSWKGDAYEGQSMFRRSVSRTVAISQVHSLRPM